MRRSEGARCHICGERPEPAFSSSRVVYSLDPPAPSAESASPTEAPLLCKLCRLAPPHYVRAVSFGPYEGTLRGLIHLLKYEGVRSAGPAIGALIAPTLVALASEIALTQAPQSDMYRRPPAPLLVPVPLHRDKQGDRHFNQSEVIARQALKHVPRGLAIELAPDLLLRHRATRSQTGLTRHQRRLNMRGAFSVPAPEKLAGRNLILLDDVFTTGTTVAECARVLRRAGAAGVWVLTAARVTRENDRMTGSQDGIAEDAGAMTVSPALSAELARDGVSLSVKAAPASTS